MQNATFSRMLAWQRSPVVLVCIKFGRTCNDAPTVFIPSSSHLLALKLTKEKTHKSQHPESCLCPNSRPLLHYSCLTVVNTDRTKRKDVGRAGGKRDCEAKEDGCRGERSKVKSVPGEKGRGRKTECNKGKNTENNTKKNTSSPWFLLTFT